MELRFLTNAAFRVSLLSDADTDLVYYKISGPNIFYRNFISKWAYFLLKAKFQVSPHGVQFLEQWTPPNNELNLTLLELWRSWVVFGNNNKVNEQNYLREIIPNVWRFIYEYNSEDIFSRLTNIYQLVSVLQNSHSHDFQRLWWISFIGRDWCNSNLKWKLMKMVRIKASVGRRNIQN